MIPFLTKLKSVARTSEEFKPDRSTIPSMHWFIRAQQFIEFLLRAIERGGSQSIPLLGLWWLRLRQGRPDGRWPFFDLIRRASHQLSDLLDAGCVRSQNSLIIAPRSSTFSYNFSFSFRWQTAMPVPRTPMARLLASMAP
jgi:hypothetical protein